MTSILVVDDDRSISNMLQLLLRMEGYSPLMAADASEARHLMEQEPIDLALVDIMMPGEDGFSLAASLIEQQIPVLFLTAKTAVADRVRGLRLGAEDYILKPFELDELIARIEVILRRTRPRDFSDSELTIQYDARLVTLRGEPVLLTTTEFDLLALLSQSPGVAFSRDKLLASVWGWDFVGETRTVGVYVQRLRAKLGANRIETVYKYGYRFVRKDGTP